MNSKKMNKCIKSYDGREDVPFDAFGSKVIPYIGWFWRQVDFDAETMLFGVIPAGAEDSSETNAENAVGFMENNKWNYPYVHADTDQWAKIKALIIVALKEPLTENFKLANDAIQALAKGKDFN